MATTGSLAPDRPMRIKLDRLLFLFGVGLLVIGVAISAVVIVVSILGIRCPLAVMRPGQVAAPVASHA